MLLIGNRIIVTMFVSEYTQSVSQIKSSFFLENTALSLKSEKI